MFFKQTLLSNRTDTNFPRNPYQVLEHIRVFQEPLFSHRTDIHFPGSPVVLKHILFSRRPLCLEQIGIFQEGTPRRTDISAIGLGGCFRIMMIRRDRKTFVNEMNKVSFFILTSLTNNAKKFLTTKLQSFEKRKKIFNIIYKYAIY